jgi:hypothetical protein
MPFQKRHALRRLAVAGAVVAALAAPVTAGAATTSTDGTSCSMPATTQVFGALGDASYYYAAPGGNFETLTWAASGGAALSSENDPFAVSGTRDRRSVRLPAGASIASGSFCVSELMPHLRLLAKSAGAGDLEIRVDLQTKDGIVHSATDTLAAGDHAAWAPSKFVYLNTQVLVASQRAQATITITNRGSADWFVDDVYVDPYAK